MYKIYFAINVKSDLVAGFTDDLTLGGLADTVAADIDHIRERKAFTGLRISASKYEIISHGTATQRPLFNNFIFLTLDGAELLRAPPFQGRKMDAAVAKRCAEFNTTINRLSLLSVYDALILFRSSFSTPKMMHMLRCSPCAKHPSLGEIDSIFRKGICAFANLDLTDPQWLQTSLSDGWAGCTSRYLAGTFYFLSVCRKYRDTPTVASTS